MSHEEVLLSESMMQAEIAKYHGTQESKPLSKFPVSGAVYLTVFASVALVALAPVIL